MEQQVDAAARAGLELATAEYNCRLESMSATPR